MRDKLHAKVMEYKEKFPSCKVIALALLALEMMRKVAGAGDGKGS